MCYISIKAKDFENKESINNEKTNNNYTIYENNVNHQRKMIYLFTIYFLFI